MEASHRKSTKVRERLQLELVASAKDAPPAGGGGNKRAAAAPKVRPRLPQTFRPRVNEEALADLQPRAPPSSHPTLPYLSVKPYQAMQ